MMVGLAEDVESVMFPHTIKMLVWGKRFNVHLRRDQLKILDISSDPGTWKMMTLGKSWCSSLFERAQLLGRVLRRAL